MGGHPEGSFVEGSSRGGRRPEGGIVQKGGRPEALSRRGASSRGGGRPEGRVIQGVCTEPRAQEWIFTSGTWTRNISLKFPSQLPAGQGVTTAESVA